MNKFVLNHRLYYEVESIESVSDSLLKRLIYAKYLNTQAIIFRINGIDYRTDQSTNCRFPRGTETKTPILWLRSFTHNHHIEIWIDGNKILKKDITAYPPIKPSKDYLHPFDYLFFYWRIYEFIDKALKSSCKISIKEQLVMQLRSDAGNDPRIDNWDGLASYFIDQRKKALQYYKLLLSNSEDRKVLPALMAREPITCSSLALF